MVPSGKRSASHGAYGQHVGGRGSLGADLAGIFGTGRNKKAEYCDTAVSKTKQQNACGISCNVIFICHTS